MKRKAFLKIFGTVIFAMFLSCILVLNPGLGEAKKKPKYKWRLGSAWTQHVRNESVQLFCDLINVYSAGRIRVKFQPSGLLGSHDEIFHAVQEGSVQMGIFAPYVNLVPGGMMNWMPWTIGSYDEAAIAYAQPGGILYKIMDKAWEEVGCKLIANLPMGSYGLGNKVRPIRTPDDLKGLKMRVSASLGFVKTLQNMGKGSGMTLQTIPWADLYNALERNVVDGSWNLWSPLVEERHYEVVKYYTALGFGFDAGNIAINRELWNKLPQDLQKAIFKAAKHAEERDYEAHRRADREYQKKLMASGLEIYFPTPEEREMFRKKANMPQVWKELCDPWLEKHFPGQNMSKKILDELDRIRVEIRGK
jgi:TRAP-type C4-dicarboxylate transport system substrate-binding protein